MEELSEEGWTGRALERRDSNLNESPKNVGVNFQKEFIHTLLCNLDLREQKDNTKISFYVETQFREGEREFTICKGLQWA